jgi:heme/copper-type cytochrome/quinol oxidase subunit 2
MAAILTMASGVVMAIVLTMLVVVVVAIRQEPRAEEMSSRAPSLTAALVRRLLGVSMRRPSR